MRAPCIVIAVFAALAAVSCGSTEPTTPTPVSGVPSRSTNPGTPTPSPSPTPTPSPGTATGTGAVQVTVSPNPVAFSGQPITDLATCSTRPNTWFYDQVLRETGGVAVTVTRRVDTFDGAASSPTNPNLRIAANGSTSIRTRWCSVAATAHTAQTSFSGTDANGKAWSTTGPLVRLQAR